VLAGFVPAPVVVKGIVLKWQDIEILDERTVGIAHHLSVGFAKPEVAHIGVVLPRLQALHELEQGVLPLAHADHVDEFQRLLRHRGGVEAAPDDGAGRSRLLQRPGGLDRHVEHAGEEGDADQLSVFAEGHEVVDHRLGHLHDVALAHLMRTMFMPAPGRAMRPSHPVPTAWSRAEKGPAPILDSVGGGF